MTARFELFNHPRLSFEAQPDGSTVARFAMNGWGADIVCRYRPVNEPGHDPWVYDLDAIEGAGGRFSHVTEYGCKLMIVRHLIDAGLIGPAEDNRHLDEVNTLIAAETEAAREKVTGKPRVGDFVIMPDGSLERCSYAWPKGHGMQTTHGGSFHITRCGSSTFSGSLNRAQLWEYFKDTGEIRRGKFWFFSHNRAGAGRGVDVFLPCRVYRLEPFAMSESEARAHTKAVRAAEVWGQDQPDQLNAVRALMEART